MKTKVEVEGYEIEIEFENGVISVKAEKDEEVVEEFTIEVEAGQSEEDSDEVQGFEEFGGQEEEEDFDGEDLAGQDEEEGEEYEDEEEDYTKRTLSYFSGDGVIMDSDTEEVIDNGIDLVGEENLEKFGEYEPEVVYVRNESNKTDYEVILEDRTYKDSEYNDDNDDNEDN